MSFSDIKNNILFDDYFDSFPEDKELILQRLEFFYSKPIMKSNIDNILNKELAITFNFEPGKVEVDQSLKAIITIDVEHAQNVQYITPRLEKQFNLLIMR